MKAPGFEKFPEYEVKLEHMNETVEVFMDGELVAESRNAICVLESSLEPVFYIPKNDLKNIDLLKTKKEYFCPFKGEAAHFTVVHNDKLFENAVWSYDDPFEEVSDLTGHVAFYPDRIDSLVVIPNATY